MYFEEPTVFVEESDLTGGLYLYRVMVDYEKYDEFVIRTGPALTWAQQADVAAGYREALTNYGG